MTHVSPATEFRFANGIGTKNRLMLAPMTNQQSHENGVMSAAELAWLRMRAEGGFGTLVSAASHVQESAKAYPGQIGCFDDLHIPGLSKFAALGREFNALPLLQLFHGGLRSPSAVTGVRPTAPSEIKLDFPGFEVPRALADHEIEKIIADFASAARRANAAGLSGVEIHAANGYLFTQFLSRVTNLRTDRWGGPLENRARFLLETIAAIRAAVPRPFLFGVRLLPEDLVLQRGFDIDEMLQVVRWLGDSGIDYLHVSSRDVRATSWKYPESPVSNVGRVREILDPKIALVAVGGVRTLNDVEFALKEGADLVAVGRSAILSPAWARDAFARGYVPQPYPMTSQELAARGVTAPFVDYLRPFGLVASS